jgi:hypothetical protein
MELMRIVVVRGCMEGDAKYAYFEKEALASPVATTEANAVTRPLVLRLPQPDMWAT